MTRLRLVRADREGDRPVSAVDDARLLAAVRAGEASMAGPLCERVRPAIHRTVRRLLGRADADFDDLVQTSMIELIRSLDSYRGECSLDGWASTIAANAVYKHLRRRGLERSVFAGEPFTDIPSAAGPHSPVLRSLVRSVLGHLKTMKAERVWAFLLHDVHGYELSELATIMGISVAAAQSRLVRGRRELQERVAGDTELAEALETWGEPE